MTCDRSNAARNSSLCCCHRTSLVRWLRKCQKSGQKADYIQCRARLASFGGGKIAKNRGKIVLAGQYHLLDTYLCQRTWDSIYGTSHEGFSLWMWVSLKAEGKHMRSSRWSTTSTGQIIRVFVSLSWCSWVWEYWLLISYKDCYNLEYMGSNTSVRAIHFGKTLCDCEFHVARTIVYIPPPSSLYSISTCWRSRECHNIVHGCFSAWVWTMQVQDYVQHCTLFVCNSDVMCLYTSPPVHSTAYTMSSSISATVSAALHKSDNLA